MTTLMPVELIRQGADLAIRIDQELEGGASRQDIAPLKRQMDGLCHRLKDELEEFSAEAIALRITTMDGPEEDPMDLVGRALFAETFRRTITGERRADAT